MLSIKDSDYSNVSSRIEEKIGRNLHNQPNHPIEIIKKKVYEYPPFASFQKFDNLSPIVSVENNFDKLLIKPEHPSRSKSDTYYLNRTTVLRTHTSAHESEIISQGHTQFLVTGDVYRKDEIDRSHYPVFHQTEGVCIMENGCSKEECAARLLKCITGLVEWLFPGCESRVNDDYFPFTNPSFEVEVKYQGEWLEILGCGVLETQIMKNNGLGEQNAWAFGLGLERLAMIMFKIPDIRLFWSSHPGFLDQFSSGKIKKFKPFSKLSSKSMDISFYIPSHRIVQEQIFENGANQTITRWQQDNDFFEFIRDVTDEWIERVELKDEYELYNENTRKYSRMYRLWYLPNDPDLKSGGDFKEIVNNLQQKLRSQLESVIDVELR